MPRRVHRSGLEPVLLVPLMYDGEPVDLARLNALGAQPTVAIRNARLVESIEQDRRRLRRLLNERRHLRHDVDHLRDARSAHIPRRHPRKRGLAPADSTVLLTTGVLLVGELALTTALLASAVALAAERRGGLSRRSNRGCRERLGVPSRAAAGEVRID